MAAPTKPRCNASVRCDTAGTMQCPTCLKLGRPEILPQSYFCSQECFKASWGLHKALHVDPAAYDPWPGFKHTGPLRPWPYGPRRLIPAHIPRPDYADDGLPRSEIAERRTGQVRVLTPDEITKMRTVCRMGREVLDLAAAAVRPGVTTDDLDKIVHDAIIERGAYPSPYNYHNFPRSVCTSINEVICHGIPDLRPLQDGDIVNLDVSVYYDGFHGDLNETYFVGPKVDELGQRLVNVARECLDKAIEICKPGANYRDLGTAISAHAHAHGLSVVRAFCGHGVHRLFHATPNVPHYAKNKAVGTMQPGHVFTIEPMICEGAHQDKRWPDDWTVVTIDGKRSAQFEHTLLITESGVEILTAANMPGLDSSYSSVYFNQKALGLETAMAKAVLSNGEAARAAAAPASSSSSAS